MPGGGSNNLICLPRKGYLCKSTPYSPVLTPMTYVPYSSPINHPIFHPLAGNSTFSPTVVAVPSHPSVRLRLCLADLGTLFIIGPPGARIWMPNRCDALNGLFLQQARPLLVQRTCILPFETRGEAVLSTTGVSGCALLPYFSSERFHLSFQTRC